jgi:class 3 adenylate cyclase
VVADRDTQAFEAAGLYDPSDPNAEDRLALLRRLVGRGLTLDEMVAAHQRGALHAAWTDLHVRPGRVVDAPTVAARVGIPVELLHRILLASGVTLRDDDYRESDAETFQLFGDGAALFGEEATLQLTRVMGSAMARVADAALSMFLVNIEAPLRQSGAGEDSLAQATEVAVEALAEVPEVLAGLFRLHVQAAITRQRIASRSVPSPGLAALAVGFVDLVGFTPFSDDIPAEQLATFVVDFEARANDVITSRGGRVVKHIGDEVMFVVTDAGTACDIALSLIETFGTETGGAPRGGVGFGTVVARGGDYYGSVVNLASRIADTAVPGEVLVDLGARDGAVAFIDQLEFAGAGRRMLKGFDEPVPLWSVTRPSPAP